jgi:high-affinity Fe2+/Pb2+ permease
MCSAKLRALLILSVFNFTGMVSSQIATAQAQDDISGRLQRAREKSTGYDSKVQQDAQETVDAGNRAIQEDMIERRRKARQEAMQEEQMRRERENNANEAASAFISGFAQGYSSSSSSSAARSGGYSQPRGEATPEVPNRVDPCRGYTAEMHRMNGC